MPKDQVSLKYACDVDLFEQDGETHIFYANGDQMTCFFLCEAVCDLPPEDFPEAFFSLKHHPVTEYRPLPLTPLSGMLRTKEGHTASNRLPCVLFVLL